MFAEVQVTENLSLDEMVAVLEVNGINAMLLCIDKKVCTLGAISPSFHVFRSVGTFAFFLGVHARARVSARLGITSIRPSARPTMSAGHRHGGDDRGRHDQRPSTFFWLRGQC